MQVAAGVGCFFGFGCFFGVIFKREVVRLIYVWHGVRSVRAALMLCEGKTSET